jgi:hypothetical protein
MLARLFDKLAQAQACWFSWCAPMAAPTWRRFGMFGITGGSMW